MNDQNLANKKIHQEFGYGGFNWLPFINLIIINATMSKGNCGGLIIETVQLVYYNQTQFHKFSLMSSTKLKHNRWLLTSDHQVLKLIWQCACFEIESRYPQIQDLFESWSSQKGFSGFNWFCRRLSDLPQGLHFVNAYESKTNSLLFLSETSFSPCVDRELLWRSNERHLLPVRRVESRKLVFLFNCCFVSSKNMFLVIFN